MGRRAQNNPRQIRIKTCGCQKCMEKYPPGGKNPERNRRRDCIGPWQARYRDPSGKQKAKNYPISEGGKKAAEAFLDDVRTRVRARTYNDPKRGQIKLGQWWDLWWKAQPARAVTTENRKKSNWNAHIKPRWSEWRLCDLEYIELQAWITRDVKGYHTRKKVLEVLNQMLKAAVKDGRIPFNPAADLDIGEAPAKHPDDTRPPTPEQVALIVSHLPVYYRPFVIFLEQTGMRWGEATGLRWENVDLEAQHLKVKEVLSDDEGRLFRKAAPKSVAGFRTVPVTPRAAEAVQTMVSLWHPSSSVTPIGDDPYQLVPEELVFRGPQGGVLKRWNFRDIWVQAITDAGIARKVKNPETGRTEMWPRVHDLRHTFATRLKDLGVPEKDAQAVMGHERGSKVTWLYQHAPEDVAAQVRARMAPESEGARQLRAV